METKLTIAFVLVLEMSLCGHSTKCPVTEDHYFKGTLSMNWTAGRNITLPCEHVTGSEDITLLEWIKDGGDLVFVSRDGQTHLNESYKHKVSSDPSRENKWELGLRKVNKSDEGEYCCCYMLGDDSHRTCSSVRLSVTEEQVTEKPDDQREMEPNTAQEVTAAVTAVFNTVMTFIVLLTHI